MKNNIIKFNKVLILIVILIITSCACSNKESTQLSSKDTKNIDLDLTSLSATFVYSEVYNMMNTPDAYIGKKIKMNGQFALYQQNINGQVINPEIIYYACIIKDATACCSQGIEFILKGNKKYPQDYPQIGTEITIVGNFQTYEENGTMYCHLVDAEIV
ncbi:MAG: hypothetical protein Q4F88_05975 [Eubacteriales bacterium]|nr:hypothetical protein [Eubacteriales bacterium]